MLVLRLLLLLSALTIVLSGGLYIFSRDRRYLQFSWQVVRFTVVVLLVFGTLFILERYVLIAWQIVL